MASPKKGRPEIKLIDPDTLSKEDKDSLRARARATIDAEVKQQTVDALYAEYLKEERRARNPAEEVKYIRLDLAAHSDRIMVDGVVYFHGTTYAVAKSLYDVMRETIQHGWRHEAETEGKLNRNAYRRPRETRIGPTGAVNA